MQRNNNTALAEGHPIAKETALKVSTPLAGTKEELHGCSQPEESPPPMEICGETHGSSQPEGDWQVEWTYIGNGEWAPPEELSLKQTHNNVEQEPLWIYKWRCSTDKDIQLHQQVNSKGYPNRWGVRIPVQTKWNLEKLGQLLTDYEDKEVVEWMRYGWPTGRLPTLPDPSITNKNHTGASEHPEALRKYIQKEQAQGAVMGPFERIPFQGKIGISPLSTRPKKDSDDRRIILDLSFPIGNSINDGMIKDNYLGFSAKLTFPKVDDFALRIYSLGKGCMMFKVDLSRYFRQLPLDPGDYSLIGYIIEGKIYFDKVLPMGMRTAPYIAQRVTNAISHIHRKLHYFLLNYVDDFVGAELEEIIWAAYETLTSLLRELRVEISMEKLVPPTMRLEFLGIIFDTMKMTMEISQDKMSNIQQELQRWLLKTSARRREVESLIGKLQFLAKCIRAGRIFLSRLIHLVKGMNRTDHYTIPLEARRDIAWWGRCAHKYNGISLMWMHKEPQPDMVIAMDACLVGYGGTWENQYFRGRFPKHLQGLNIAYLEILAVMVALKIRGQKLEGLYFWIHVDNEAVAAVLNTRASRDVNLQKVLREIALIAAEYQFVIKARHISGISNRIPDWLSRWHDKEAREKFRQHAKDSSLKHIRSSTQLLHLSNTW